ncbi:unnamed protein product [Rotaria magnacalcarata]|uniref:Copine C-terminal domain-containing protein n=1 Tax=Rotaria magnacalcarata TaxID=392030 RepID=A0A819GBN5_9BILA|nr:unnamed protein product [Rotaria magnacalcarata]CAF3880442.1 unnamed protein product [Rotaria magnacalcarata]
MLAPLVWYSVAFLVYVLLYDYYRHRILKERTTSDLLKTLENTQFNSIPTSKKKLFVDIKKEIHRCFDFKSIRVIFGIDFSASNEWQGRKTFNGQFLHKTDANKIYNPYQKAITQLGDIFQDVFPKPIGYSCFGFGDQQTKDFSFFPIVGSGEAYNNYQLVLEAYLEQTKDIASSGPTNYAPIIQALISHGIRCERDFTMLVILTDELKMSHEDNSLVEAIYTLSNLPNTCLLVVGVGDGPWQKLSYEEHCLRELVFKKKHQNKKKFAQKGIVQSYILFDNFHFVDFNTLALKSDKIANENYLARAVLAKLPTQFKQACLTKEDEYF